MESNDLKQKIHYIAVTGIIQKDGKYLICKRSPNEKLFPNKWCVPGGKLEQKDFVSNKKDVGDYWLDVFEKVVKREIFEETGIEVKNLGYVSNLAFLRPNGHSTIIVSLFGDFDKGEIKLADDELVDHAWVTVDELKNYDLLENLYEQIIKADKMIN